MFLCFFSINNKQTQKVMRREFNVLCEIDSLKGFNNVTTFHFSVERTERHNKIVSIIGKGKCVAMFVVDTAHINGNEIHCVYDNGIIVIYNERTKRLITELIARPQQIYRYWNNLGISFPQKYNNIISKARIHQEKGYNNW